MSKIKKITKEISEGNKLIAKFMGGKFTLIKSHTPNIEFKEHPRQDRNFNNICPTNLHPKYLSYHKSWDWLMPVVEEIEKTKGIHVEFSQVGCRILSFGKDTALTISDKKINAVWGSVVKYIEQLNKKS